MKINAKKILSLLISAILMLTSVGGIVTSAENAGEPAAKTYETLKVGIDVSEHQGVIDWSKVKDEVDFAMIRVGCTYTKSLAFHVDDYFTANVEGATAAGIPIGIYYYGCATSTDMAVKEAEFVLEQLAKYPGAFSYPIVYDIEVSSSTNSAVPPIATEVTTAFCNKIREAGYYPMVYSFVSYVDSYLKTADISSYDFWLAHFTCPAGLNTSQFVDNAGTRKTIMSSPNGYNYDSNTSIWQCTDAASISGISGEVDGNICYFDYEAFIKAEGYNGFEKTAGDRTATCVSSKVNVRSGASTAYEIVGEALNGDQFDVKGIYNKNWIEIDYNGESAFVHASYFTVEDTVEVDAPVDDPDDGTVDEDINNEPQEVELNFWQKIGKIFSDFFAGIANFFKGLFS